MFPRKRVVFSLGISLLRARPTRLHSHAKQLACLSSASHHNKEHISVRAGKLTEKDDGTRGGTAEEEADRTVETAKAGVVGAMEAGLKMGEMAKQTADVMWDAVKNTTEDVKNSVAGDSNNSDGYRRSGGDHISKRSGDKHGDAWGGSGGYDY